MTRFISLLVLVAIVLVIGLLSYRVMASFLLPMFLALLLVVMFKPLHQWFLAKCRSRTRLAAGLTTLSILLIVLLPTMLIIAQAASEAVAIVGKLDHEQILRRLRDLRTQWSLDGPAAEVAAALDEMEADLAELAAADNAGAAQAALTSLVQQSDDVAARLGLDGAKRPRNANAPSASTAEAWRNWTEALEKLRAAGGLAGQLAQQRLLAEAALGELKMELFGGPLAAWIRSELSIDPDQLKAMLGELKSTAGTVAGKLALGAPEVVGNLLFDSVVGLFVLVVSLYYFLADGPGMVDTLMRLSPLDDRYERELLTEFTRISRAVVVATILAAFVQGVLAGIAYYVVGFHSVFLLTVITMLLAMVPFVGAASVWGGCALWLLVFEGDVKSAVGLALYGGLVVSTVDNLIKPMVLHGQSNLHPLLALLSVLGGVKALGPIGIFVGPMVVAFLQALLVMLRSELETFDKKSDVERALQG